MKLRNKKTGNIVDCAVYCNGTFYHSVNDVFEEWEDYEEPEGMQWVDVLGANDGRVVIQYSNEEEAKKAVEKLKAWKRLKDKGAEFYGWRRNQTGTYELYLRWEDRIPRSYEVKNDLDLLFGGEE